MNPNWKPYPSGGGHEIHIGPLYGCVYTNKFAGKAFAWYLTEESADKGIVDGDADTVEEGQQKVETALLELRDLITLSFEKALEKTDGT